MSNNLKQLASHIQYLSSHGSKKVLKAFYNGCEQDSILRKQGTTNFPVYNPATGEKLIDVQHSNKEDIEKAIESAKNAFKLQSNTCNKERGRILKRTANLLRQNNFNIAKLETQNQGKCISESSSVDVSSAADALDYYGSIAEQGIEGSYIPFSNGSFSYTRREPLGVIAGIGAQNYPLQIACQKAAPALACGNTFVYKPSELTPITTSILAHAFKESGLPSGVFNVVYGGSETGQILSKHSSIEKISFTGSTLTGKSILKNAAETIKYSSMELGGKSPFIVFSDADINQAVSAALLANFYTQGEICSNGTRIYVQNDIYDAFMEKFKLRTMNLVIGDPLDPNSQVGPLINRKHFDKVMSYIESAIKDGAKIVCGGKRYIPKEKHLEKGNFIEPTIFESCTESMKFVQDEIFGPVAAVMRFDTEEEVIERANNTRYGLAGGIFTKNLKLGHRVAAKLQCGVVQVNNYNITPLEMPFGGYKQSGIGRECGRTAIEYYTQLKSVYVEMDKVDCPYS